MRGRLGWQYKYIMSQMHSRSSWIQAAPSPNFWFQASYGTRLSGDTDLRVDRCPFFVKKKICSLFYPLHRLEEVAHVDLSQVDRVQGLHLVYLQLPEVKWCFKSIMEANFITNPLDLLNKSKQAKTKTKQSKKKTLWDHRRRLWPRQRGRSRSSRW